MTDNPQPGRELDEAIARALGWKIGLEHAPELDEDCAYESWQSPDGSFHGASPPCFSTDTATAMATLEQLCKPVEEGGRGWPYWISSPLRPGRAYGVRCNNHKTKATTLAHAVSLAMLAALEAEK